MFKTAITPNPNLYASTDDVDYFKLTRRWFYQLQISINLASTKYAEPQNYAGWKNYAGYYYELQTDALLT